MVQKLLGRQVSAIYWQTSVATIAKRRVCSFLLACKKGLKAVETNGHLSKCATWKRQGVAQGDWAVAWARSRATGGMDVDGLDCKAQTRANHSLRMAHRPSSRSHTTKRHPGREMWRHIRQSSITQSAKRCLPTAIHSGIDGFPHAHARRAFCVAFCTYQLNHSPACCCCLAFFTLATSRCLRSPPLSLRFASLVSIAVTIFLQLAKSRRPIPRPNQLASSTKAIPWHLRRATT